MAQERTKTICDVCSKEGTYQEVGRGEILIVGLETKPLIQLKDVCGRCADKAAEAVREKLKIVA